MSIQVNNISKQYGKQKALNDVSFSIGSGKIVGFLGPNGAGKSTMMKIITGFIPPSGGTVLVNGINVEERPLETKKVIGYLPENNPLYLDMYVKEYLIYVGKIYGLGKNLKTKVDDIVSLTGLEMEKHKKIEMLSKGYKQRVGLAQALLHDPDVLVLDEPTSGLDPNQIVEIRELIAKVGKQKTVMLSTHIMQEVEAICDEVIIIKQGEIVANETTTGIKNKTVQFYQTIQVEFDKYVEEKKLRAIEGLGEVKHLRDNIWVIAGEENTDLRPQIFNFAVQEGLMVLSMQEKEKSLEDVFRELTS